MWHCHDRSGVSVRNMIQGRGGGGDDRKGRVGGAVLPRANQTCMYTTKVDAPFTASGPERHPVQDAE